MHFEPELLITIPVFAL
ncbi:Hypothetical protein SSCIU_01196 [Mammaliicoccus sciuri]|nr:Hypothetical protein SSCIU_01196 [Mammaliicoccus sciuri]